MDITEIIQQQHDEQRRGFAMLEEWPRDDTEGLAAMWRRLAILLENHAEAEERYFYPELLKLGTGAADAPDAEDETDDAIHDHNNIRKAIRKADRAKTGTDEWWTAVTDCNVYNSRHMGEEERQDLADFRQQTSLQLRHDIAIRFLRLEAMNASSGVRPTDKDPDEYVEDHEQSQGKPAAAERSPGPHEHSKTAGESASS